MCVCKVVRLVVTRAMLSNSKMATVWRLMTSNGLSISDVRAQGGDARHDREDGLALDSFCDGLMHE